MATEEHCHNLFYLMCKLLIKRGGTGEGSIGAAESKGRRYLYLNEKHLFSALKIF
jgi:hypothetical protein